MNRWLKAFQLLGQMLAAIDNAVQGLPAEFVFEYKGKVYKISLTQAKL